ncbi:MAG TPA: acyl-CoA dehydrogenase family protein [Sphingobium sp.]|nr:acyl-CoA dehydrogenase family protein [Sphingobium sp.]
MTVTTMQHSIMDHADDPARFRTAVREWLGDVLPGDWREQLAGKPEDAYVALQRWWLDERRRAGLVLPSLPRSVGGSGLSIDCQLVLAEESARAGTPPLELAMFMVSLTHVPATLLEWGTPEQQRAYLPGLIAGDVWCQGFSEPGAGSDLAALRTRAVRQGDVYVVNGQKIWSSYSRYARYCLLLVRTDSDAPKHRGISYLILDMETPGVEVRPIRQATGDQEFSEIFLTDVRIPVENLIGPENQGWKVAQSTLAAERGLLAFERSERQLVHVENHLTRALDEGADWTRSEDRRGEFMELLARMQSVRRMIRSLLRDDAGKAQAKMLPAIIKLSSSIVSQDYADFLVRVGDIEQQFQRQSFVCDGRYPMYDYIYSFGDTISAGSNEIMRNLIAERRLGLPRDDRA